MKRAVQYSYTFLPVSNSLNLSAIPNFNINKLFAVLDTTSVAAGSNNGILYAAGQPGLGYTSLSGGVMILQASMAGCTPQDSLMIIYDDGDQATTAASGYVQLVTSNAVVSSTNPVPVTIQTQESGIAQDSTVEDVVTSLGTIGESPPTLPGTSTGVMGLLRAILAGCDVQGMAGSGFPVTGDPILIGGSDGTDVRTALTDPFGGQITATSLLAAYNITTATVVKASPGYIGSVSVLVSAGTEGSINNCTNTGSVATSNQITNIPTLVGVYPINWPCEVGICITPGTGQTLAVSYR